MAQAKSGDTVRVHYTGTLADGTVFDSSRQRDPLEFQVGSGQVIRGFEQAVAGMEPGETKVVDIASDEAYGPRREELTTTVPADQFPDNIDPQVGQQLQMVQGGDQAILVTVTDVSDAGVRLDANHPLAGKDLKFDLELVEIV